MKYKFLILICLFFPVLFIPPFCMAEFFGSGEFGYCRENEDYYTELEIGYRFHPWILQLELYGGIEVLMEKDTSVFFKLYRDIFTAGGILRYKSLYFKIEHKCMHPVHANDELFVEKFIEEEGRNRTRFGIGFEF